MPGIRIFHYISEGEHIWAEDQEVGGGGLVTHSCRKVVADMIVASYIVYHPIFYLHFQ